MPGRHRSPGVSQTHQAFCYSNTQYSSNVKRCTYKGKLMLRKSFSNLYAPYKYSQSKEELDTRTTYYGVILIIGA